MPLFQKPARTPEEIAASRPLEIQPAEVATFDEETWYRCAFRGEQAPQLTLRAVVLGSLLGFLLAFTNLYVGLKTGWGLGVAITACIVSFSLWNLCLRIGLARSPLSILESNCMQSTASAAGYSTGSTMVSATPALLMLSVSAESPTGHHLPWPVLAGWTFFLALLGVALAIPMKRNMINQEKLRFPSGIAAAVTLQSLYSQGKEAAAKGKALFYAALVAAVPPLIMDLPFRRPTPERPYKGLVPDTTSLFDWLPVPGKDPKTGAAYLASDWNFVLDNKLVMIAAGALTGTAHLLFHGRGRPDTDVLGRASRRRRRGRAKRRPRLARHRHLDRRTHDDLRWPSHLLHPVADHRARHGRTRPDVNKSTYATAEVPGSWFLGLGLVATAGVLFIGHTQFFIPWHLGFIAVLLTFFLSLVACRATGESDITPIGAMGKVTQLVYGVLIPQNATANLMTASITANAAASSADLLTDLKSGYLLGAHPRRQFLAQLHGCVRRHRRERDRISSPGPRRQRLHGIRRSAARLRRAQRADLAGRGQALSRRHRPSPRHGPPRNDVGPARWRRAVGPGNRLAQTPTLDPLAHRHRPRLHPALLQPVLHVSRRRRRWLWSRRNHAHADRYVVPVSSGIIAGESIVSVAIALVNNVFLRR
jgi:hypothetical protein